MRNRLLALLAGALTCLAVAAPAGAATPLFGFNDNAVLWNQLTPAQDVSLAKGAGATTHRFTFDWRWAEPTQGKWSLGTYDAIYNADVAAGIAPILTVLYSPQWTWSAGTPCVQATQDCRYAPGANHLDAWRTLFTTLTARYPKLAGIEVWNEPNMKAMWSGGLDPAYYARLVNEAASAVHSSGSAVPVLGGSLANIYDADSTDALSLKTFLNGMYAAGVKGSMDGLSVHPYPSADIDLWRTFETLDDVREIQAANGDSMPLWLTELGVSLTDTSGSTWTEDSQARLLTRIVTDLRAMPDVKAVVVHTLMDATRYAPLSRERGFGVVYPGGKPKTAYCALAALNGTGYVCPADTPAMTTDVAQNQRWDAQELVQRAADAAVAYRSTAGAYAGVTSATLHSLDPALSATAGDGALLPGPAADPSRIAVYVLGTGADERLLVCNTSKADRSYCIYTAYGKYWRYGMGVGNVQYAASLVTKNLVWWW